MFQTTNQSYCHDHCHLSRSLKFTLPGMIYQSARDRPCIGCLKICWICWILFPQSLTCFLSHYFYIMWITWDLGLRDGRLGKLGHRRLENQFQTIGLPSEFLKPKRLRRGMRTSCWGEGFSDQQIVGYLVVLPCFFLIFRQTIIIRMEGTLQCSHNNPFRLYVLNIFKPPNRPPGGM
jgi:hypothetical protein